MTILEFILAGYLNNRLEAKSQCLSNPWPDVSMFMCRCCHSCSIDLTFDLWEVLPGGCSPAWLFLSGHWDPLRSANTSQSINITLHPRPNIFCDPSYVPDSSKYTQTPDMSALSDACYLLLQNRTRCVMRGSTHAFVMCLENSNRLANVSVCNAVFLYCIIKYIIKLYIFYCKNNNA